MRLSTCLHQYFYEYLPRIKGVSEHSIKAYQQTFALFLYFLAGHHSIKIKSLKIDHLTVDAVLAFLHYLEKDRKNTVQTRNQRLAVIKSLAKMIRFMHPDKKPIAEAVLTIPQKRAQKKVMGFLYPEEIMKVFNAVDLKKKEGMRDFTILHLLYDSGARASEIATLEFDYFDPENETIAVLGKGNRYRLIALCPRTASLISDYITNHRVDPILLFSHRLFINQRKRGMTRHGINKICRKYLTKALPEKRLKGLSPAHCFRHSCAVTMVTSGESVSDIKNRLGHQSVESTMIYLQLDLSKKRKIQSKLMKYMQSKINHDKKIDELIDWKNSAEILAWLDSL
jgi:site-specific recombinase XerD